MDRGFSPRALAAFELLFLPWMRRRVRAVRLAGLPAGLPPRSPLLLVANHVSWWDGFVLREVHRRLRPDAPLHTVMLASELERRPFFRRLGAVGIDPASPPSVARALRELGARVRERPESVVAYFPQGRIWPSYRRPLGFRRGVELFARRLGPLAALPVGIHLEPLAEASPTLFASVGDPVPAERGVEAGDLERRVEGELDRILAFLATRGEAAAGEWPAPHLPLPAAGPGGAGVRVSGAGEATG